MNRREALKKIGRRVIGISYGPNIVAAALSHHAEPAPPTVVINPSKYRIACFGASTTCQPDLHNYPSQLERTLQTEGYDAVVHNYADESTNLETINNNIGKQLRDAYDCAIVSEQWNFVMPSSTPDDVRAGSALLPFKDLLWLVPYAGVACIAGIGGILGVSRLTVKSLGRDQAKLAKHCEVYRQYLDSIVNKVVEHHAVPVVGIHPDGWNEGIALDGLIRTRIGDRVAYSLSYKELFLLKRALGSTIREYAQEKGVQVLDWEHQFTTQYSDAERLRLFSDDMVHPNAEGAAAMAKFAYEKVKQVTQVPLSNAECTV